MTVQTSPFAGLRLHDIQTWGNGEDIDPNYWACMSKNCICLWKDLLDCAEGYYAIVSLLYLPI